jgi:hypothetical protein
LRFENVRVGWGKRAYYVPTKVKVFREFES